MFAKTMKNAMSYKVSPSSNERDRLEVVIAWNDKRRQFMFDVKKGGHRIREDGLQIALSWIPSSEMQQISNYLRE